MPFNCTRCGLCCKNAGRIPGFPLPLKPGTNECRYLSADNLCEIYDHRPMICQIDKGRPVGISRKRWYALNEEGCRQLQTAAGD